MINKQNEKNNANDLSEILSEYENKWVVLSPDRSKVLASGDDFDTITDYLKNGFAMKVPRFIAYIPHFSR